MLQKACFSDEQNCEISLGGAARLLGVSVLVICVATAEVEEHVEWEHRDYFVTITTRGCISSDRTGVHISGTQVKYHCLQSTYGIAKGLLMFSI